ncbi:MAG: hypothetical protein Q8P18_00490 [Pseudomonadota bacterium]|nr:hypothetical protein [Pseudomonadota bacterium]
MQEVDRLIETLRKASYKEREPIKAQLTALATGANGPAVRDHIDAKRRGELLEVQWELEEVLEAATPKKPEEPKKAEEPAPPAEPAADPNRPLTAKDLVVVYDDPRGLMLHKAKVGDRWFATQFDQRTGQPQTFELQAAEIAQLKTQLAGSPYWVIGAPGAPVVAGAGAAGPVKAAAGPGPLVKGMSGKPGGR